MKSREESLQNTFQLAALYIDACNCIKGTPCGQVPPRGGTNASDVPTGLAEEVDTRNNVSPPEEGSAGLVLSSSPLTQVKLGGQRRWTSLW